MVCPPGRCGWPKLVEEVDAVRQQNLLMMALKMTNKDGSPPKRTKYDNKDMPPDGADCMGLTLKFSYSAKATTHNLGPLSVLHHCVQKYSENSAGSATLKPRAEPVRARGIKVAR